MIGSSPRILLSPPHMGGEELALVQEAFASNWIAPAGPHLDRFEREFCEETGAGFAVAVASGTAALHLALRLSGVESGDEVWCSTLTFVASANPIVYLGAEPVFLDCDARSWNMDPVLLQEELDAAARRRRLPKAVVLVHLYGQSADLDPIQAACDRHGVALIEDAAESLGATYKGGSPGTRGLFGAYSFNGNKIITTSGGGMLVSHREDLVRAARSLSTQSREDAPHYEHARLGYNYRMSNVLAAIGRGQLRLLEDRVAKRREIFHAYERRLQGEGGVSFMPEASYGRATRWLSVLTIDAALFGAGREDVRLHLEEEGIESRPVWKPMHLQPVFRSCRFIGSGVSNRLFEHGLCLPSGTQLEPADIDRVVDAVLSTPRRRIAAV